MPGQRYCEKCDFQSAREVSGISGGRGAGAAAHRSPAAGFARDLRLFFLLFLAAGLATLTVGLSASGYSLADVRRAVGLDAPALADTVEGAWGEIRWVHTVTRVRAGRSTDARIVDRLHPGDSVRADFAAAGWMAIFPPDGAARDLDRARGFVYEPLLKRSPPGGGGGGAR